MDVVQQVFDIIKQVIANIKEIFAMIFGGNDNEE